MLRPVAPASDESKAGSRFRFDPLALDFRFRTNDAFGLIRGGSNECQGLDRRYGLHKFDDAITRDAVADALKGEDEFDTFARRRERFDVGAFARGPFLGFEEVGNGQAQRIGDLLETPGSDPVSAILVFLHLLEGDADSPRQSGLAHTDHQAALADARADDMVSFAR